MFQEVWTWRSRAPAAGPSFAVLYLDLDNFKLVNDSLGHAAGDELLRQMAGRLRDTIRESDLVSRLGGDEFLILLADLERHERRPIGDPQHALLAAEVGGAADPAIRSGAVRARGDEVYVSASIGISVFPLDAEDGSTLLQERRRGDVPEQAGAVRAAA